MEEVRDGDLRVPLISSIFFIAVLIGGIFLILYVFVPSVSRSWFPIVALLMIGSPWIFWFLTYFYTCIKACFGWNRNIEERKITKGNTSTMRRNPTTKNPGADPSNGERHVRFGEVAVEGEENRGRESMAESSINSAKEIEMPLNLAPSS